MSLTGWIAVDFDGTLVEYDGWKGADHIGVPIPAMVERVKGWLAQGKDVRIFTARVWCDPKEWDWNGERGRSSESYAAQEAVEVWCREHLGAVLPVTCTKDYGMVELWDDRCVQVEANTGRVVSEDVKRLLGFLNEIARGGVARSNMTAEAYAVSALELHERFGGRTAAVS